MVKALLLLTISTTYNFYLSNETLNHKRVEYSRAKLVIQ